MLREWLLIVWLGTTSNFVLISHHPNWPDCDQERDRLQRQLGPGNFRVECRQDMREGRSSLPRRGPGVGIIK